MSPPPTRFFLRGDRLREFIDAQHATQSWAASEVGVSRSYWSQLMNSRRPLSPTVRRMLLDSVFGQLGEDELWERRCTSPDGQTEDTP